jgi:hypothetical protein
MRMGWIITGYDIGFFQMVFSKTFLVMVLVNYNNDYDYSDTGLRFIFSPTYGGEV